MSRSNLPEPGSLLVDGTKPLTGGASFKGYVPVATHSEAQALVTSTKRKLLEMPGTPAQLNGWSAVLVYTASGLDDNEISLALRITPAQVRNIRKQPGYQQLEQYMLSAAKEQSSNAVQDILAGAEVRAANRLTELVDESVDLKIALAASNSVLDRRGHKAADKLDIRSEMVNTFRIEYVDKRGAQVPVIDMELEDGDST
ncbi:hypothetical protein UFOVP568_3 [uncultured Caudovirales phage]|uniref:Uncharacterized protein n=1 Tax=uncultured Caudovirales phage TaxID=2100421 RepID=A0A6J5MZ29_9CAUD|nr:hypothetical protein UFOVP568_3 [uncultured Caudovirales phage]